jgi:hypothetical protein
MPLAIWNPFNFIEEEEAEEEEEGVIRLGFLGLSWIMSRCEMTSMGTTTNWEERDPNAPAMKLAAPAVIVSERLNFFSIELEPALADSKPAM